MFSFSRTICLIWIKYYLKAIASPLGQQVRDFYTSTSKQVIDIHAEARRIAAQEKVKAGGPASATNAPTVPEPVESKAEPSVESKAEDTAVPKADL